MYPKWRPVLNEAGIDLMLCGHTHRYAVNAPQPGEYDFPIVIGGGPEAGKAVVMRVEVNKDKLELTMTRDDREVVGTYTIRKD
jgi:acid phosphatase type 7